MTRRVVPIVLAGLLALSACASDKKAAEPHGYSSVSAGPSAGPSAPPAAQVCPAGDARIVKGDAGVKVTGTAGKKPTVTLPKRDFDCLFYVQDLIEGDGTEVAAGATVTAHYVGVSWTKRAEFDASWGGDPATFPLQQVVKGWQLGIPGMKVGGRRLLVIPPFLGYGPRTPDPNVIAVDDTLVFVIDLTAVS